MNKIEQIDKNELMKDFLVNDETQNLLEPIKKISDLYLKSCTLRFFGSMSPLDSTISALSEKLRQIEEIRLKSFLDYLYDKVVMLDKEKIDWEFINSEKYVRLLFEGFNKIKKEYRHDKLRYFANILLNYSTYQFSNDFYKEGIIEKVSRYSGEHIVVLNNIYLKRLEREQLTQGDTEYYNGDIDIKVFSVMGLEKEIVGLCIIDLVSDGFLREITATLTGYTGGYYEVTKYGMKLIELVEDINFK